VRVWFAGGVVLFVSLAHRADASAQLLDFIGAMPDAGPAPLDPSLPTGARLTPPKSRPPSAGLPACSFVHPVCVHLDARSPASAELALTELGALEQAYEKLVFALDLPAPLPDRGAGDSDALDLYLSSDTTRGDSLDVIPDSPIVSGFDQTPAHCLLAGALNTADSARRAATLCVAEAILLRLDAGETPHLRRAIATELWLSIGKPTSADFQALDDVQANPERAVVRRDRDEDSGGAAVFFEYLEQARAAAAPGTLSAALLALGAGKTPGTRLFWDNEPDLLDVLRHTLHEDRPAVAALWGDFAVSRAFLGTRDDGQHLPKLAWAGNFGRVRFDWLVKFSSLPRRLAATRPIEPSGAFYTWLDLDQVPAGAVLWFHANWEAPAPFKWALVRVDKDGVELSRIDVPFQERGSEVEARVTNLDNAAAVLVVGTNLGGVDLAHPLDPDFSPFEGQRCTIYLSKL
jgi:hypothetical protein